LIESPAAGLYEFVRLSSKTYQENAEGVANFDWVPRRRPLRIRPPEFQDLPGKRRRRWL